MKFYTGQGDKGETTLRGLAQKVSKTDQRIEALGALDELNSYLGVCKSQANDEKVENALHQAQENLFIIQAQLGNLGTSDVHRTSDVQILKLEKTIDEFGEFVGPITKFTIAGGEPLSAQLDYARAICRRAERANLAVKPPLGGSAAKYLNRLSSLLFVLARYANKKAGVFEDHPAYK